MIFKLRPKALFKFLGRLCRKSPPDLWQFGLAVREVMAARILLAMTGELSAAEARRMVVEKQLAVVGAQLAYSGAILNGESAPGAYFDVYQRAVKSNRERLSKRRWLATRQSYRSLRRCYRSLIAVTTDLVSPCLKRSIQNLQLSRKTLGRLPIFRG